MTGRWYKKIVIWPRPVKSVVLTDRQGEDANKRLQDGEDTEYDLEERRSKKEMEGGRYIRKEGKKVTDWGDRLGAILRSGATCVAWVSRHSGVAQ